MTRERRIHQIAHKFQVRREFRQQRQQKYMKDEDEAEDIEFEDDMYDRSICSIKADSHCFQLSVVHGIATRRFRVSGVFRWNVSHRSIGALSSFLEEDGANEDEAREQGAERDRDDEDDEDHDRDENLEEPDEG
ncbi:hypothetical protein GCG54_00001032 [Colletotrichum gloeosporioides]|uniref:Uncharacterized protein n=1 Tax=Colletotrichum gloeosporioides TaxID=474922 RepID=A0A8H4C988_COLGL|nr:uncharacterized protein GCG54_00001032 [Colletotrichum gloeosporioides]KAF3799785.1 hypothetical protein GCG54_00001032 [Colletotrichum gloeosporioides]